MQLSEERDLDLLHHRNLKSARQNENTGRCNISVGLFYARVVKFVRSPSEDGWTGEVGGRYPWNRFKCQLVATICL
jgi:hypothetical protein